MDWLELAEGLWDALAWQTKGFVLLAVLGVLWAGGKVVGAAGRRLGNLAGRVTSPVRERLKAWWRKPGRLARIEEHLAGLAPPRPAARPVDWCCAACGLHRQLFASDACRCGCAAVVPAGAYGTKGNHVGGDHAC